MAYTTSFPTPKLLLKPTNISLNIMAVTNAPTVTTYIITNVVNEINKNLEIKEAITTPVISLKDFRKSPIDKNRKVILFYLVSSDHLDKDAFEEDMENLPASDYFIIFVHKVKYLDMLDITTPKHTKGSEIQTINYSTHPKPSQITKATSEIKQWIKSFVSVVEKQSTEKGKMEQVTQYKKPNIPLAVDQGFDSKKLIA